MSTNRVVVVGLIVLSILVAAGGAFAGEGPAEFRWSGEKQGGSGDVIAVNSVVGLEARLGSDGLRVTPVEGDWSFSLGLAQSGREGFLSEAGPVTPRADGTRAELDRGNIVEWWLNSEQGLEHGFTVRQRPEGDGPLVLELELQGDLLALTEPGERGVVLLRPGTPQAVLHYSGLEVFDAQGTILSARLAVADSMLRIVIEDQGAAYPLHIDPLLTTAAWSSTESDETRSVAWGDWDGDGDLDLAAGNANLPNRVYENTGGALTSAWTSVDSDTTLSVVWGDWDSDGDLDLAAGNSGQPNRIYENTGGALASAWTSIDSEPTQSVAWGDWDSDGDLDLAAGNYDGANRVYENTGGALASAWTSVDSDSTYSVAWGDWDADGDLDLVAGNYDGANRVYENTGGALASAWTSADNDLTLSVAWGDWDSDGDLDLVAGNNGANRVYENTGGALASAWTSADNDLTLSVAWGDWDSDGDLDLAAGKYGANRVYENTGGALSSAWTSADNDETWSVAWGDWDSDGDLDLAVGNSPNPNRVYENTGGALASAWTSADSDQTLSVAWGDWDSDGDLDLVAGNHGQPNRVYENAEGALASAWTSVDSAVTFSVAWGDWDSDGDLDLAAGNNGQLNRVYENIGGTLAVAWVSADSDGTRSVAWGDWDSDGDLDLAAGNEGQPNRVYENTGGALASAWTSADSDGTWSVAWGDWDSDGDLDLAAGNFDQPNRVYENTGGVLVSAWTSVDYDFTYSVAWGDWDSDGDLDLAAGNSDQPNRVYENTGGALASAWTSVDSDGTHSVAWGDWDSDGDLDLAAGNWGANRVYENTGGALASAWTSVDTDATWSVAWGDWDSDGDLDLAAGNIGRNRVYENGNLRRPGGVPESPASPVVKDRPGLLRTDAAFFFSAARFLSWPVYVEYLLVDEEQDPARRIVAEYSLVNGGPWYPATQAPGGSGSEDLATQPGGHPHLFVWDNLADGVYRGDSLRFRITVPYQASTRLAGPIQRAAMKAVSPPFRVRAPAAADLWVTTTDGQDQAIPGETITYTITVANDGPDDVVGASVSDTFPASITGVSWTCDDTGGGTCGSASGSGDIAETVDLPDGASLIFTATGTVDPAASGMLANTVEVTIPGGMTEIDETNNSTTDINMLVPSTDLSVTLDNGVGEAVSGEGVIYQIVISNSGPSDAGSAQVVDLFPAEVLTVDWTCVGSGGGTCTVAGSGDIGENIDLPVGAWVTFTVNADIDPAATGVLVNTASVHVGSGRDGDRSDPNPGDNVATDIDTLTPEADLMISKDDGTDMSVLGRQSVYVIVASNPGPSDVPGATVSDVFPAELVGATWTCTGVDGGVCNAGGAGDIDETVDLPSGATVTFTATATVDPGSTGATLENTANVTCPGSVAEREPADNTATDSNSLWEEIFSDGFESSDTGGWS